ncbi:hypothetical protein [Parasutterella muris]|uniref:Uncharacterized protein n=2 Tax=Parasutterella muris TaxID=2565572 RepID=A0A6L6YIV9_9BURK|nr:hypothetical protein [Parasutterella muris]MVX56628.1 hypothetical protein [Parasutterella muris]
MSIMDSVMQSTVGFVLLILIGLVGLPLLVLVPVAGVILVWKAIGEISNPFFRDLLHGLFLWFFLVVFVIKTTNINWFRKHLWRLPELKDPQ